MAHAISMDDGETRVMPNERLETLKRRFIPALGYQQELGDGDPKKIMDCALYEATKKGDIEEFINAIEKVCESRKLALSLIFDQVTPSKNSLLHVAASFGHNDVMELILNHFPNTMTLKNSSEDTPLHVAVQDQKLSATEKLICLGTYSEIIYWKNKDSKSPLYLAIEKCEQNREGVGWEILQLLLREFTRDEAYAVKIQGKSPVLAALEKKSDLLEEIIDRLPKLLHVRDENGRTLLHSAASGRNLSAVRVLQEKCPYLALQTDENGSYPIHIAGEGSHSANYLLLQDTWPDLSEIINGKGQNVLHVAAKAGHDYAVHSVLEKYDEPDIIEKLVNSKDVDGNTPLHLASMHNHCQVMRHLAGHKIIDLELKNNDGLTALEVAIESKSLSTENPALLGRAILIVAYLLKTFRLPLGQHFGASKSSPAEWIKDQVNTLLLVATLVASVTFTASLTFPGGYNTSGDPHPGTATMLHHRMFQVFIIANMLAMYSSILAVVVLLWGLNRDFHIAELAYHSAGPLLLTALTGMSVAFSAAAIIAVSKLIWLKSLVLFVGVLHPMMVALVLATLIVPSAVDAMLIVVFYYMVASKVGGFVKYWLKVLAIILLVPALLCFVCVLLCILCILGVVNVCKRMFH